jgi:putative NADPH-quinone reductase
MHVLAVLAHPKKDATCSTLFYAAVEHLRASGATVDVLDLYEHAHEIPFLQLPVSGQSAESVMQNVPFYWQNKERFMAADRLLLAYPVWWYAVPGIMKAWLDLITNYAWQFTGGNKAKALHKVQKTLIINTAGMNWWHRLIGTRNSATEMIKASCTFLSIPHCKAYEVNATKKLTSDAMAKHTQKIMPLCDWLIR